MVIQENEENSILPRYSRERARAMIMSVIIEHMHSIGVVYPYCNFRWQQEQKPVDLLASLLIGEEEQCVLLSFRMITSI
jgi:hypothetical protein